ncbi:MAG: hypothetical protein Q7R62_02290 [bacterium]|nr:hypothetical protein [bacterium]
MCHSRVLIGNPEDPDYPVMPDNDKLTAISMNDNDERRQQVLYDQKWQKLLKRVWLFRHIPFVDFVFGSGSMAVGNVTNNSDFDVLIGARQRRIFTSRFFAILFFSLFGWRRGKNASGASVADKICLNHFITPASYRFALEKNPYWEQIYQGLVPIFGDERFMRIFLQANAELIPQPKRVLGDLRYRHHKSSFFKRSFEKLLVGKLGDWFEKKVKAIQVARIEKGLSKAGESHPVHRIAIMIPALPPTTYDLPPLIRYNDNELEFHPDPAVIEVS